MNIEVVKETRFAVVMYGGVSLAIYINGVAQELLRMVRVTAVKDNSTKFRVPDEKLTALEKLYRDLSYLIADEELLNDTELLESYRDWLRTHRKGENPLTARLDDEESQGENRKVARFIVDILSGSSAGGINGVYMAKAIVGGQSLDTLEKLWIGEGDFSKLLNDEHSVFDTPETDEPRRVELGLNMPETPPSLLNSERMYLKLLTAFQEMDDEDKSETGMENTSYVDEVDLFVTLTDFYGIPVPIRLFDQLIHERRHRQNLHFRFRRDDNLNEFIEEMYPFLAFSARGTSSFPLAFDPMQVKRANDIIEAVRKNHVAGKGNIDLPNNNISKEIWKPFFRPETVQDNQDDEKVEIDWEKRVFVDGGYLDNKPFGYAIEALAQKQSNVLVDRKLIYVEPEPEKDDSHNRLSKTDPPTALTNTLAALTDLPRYETIREDLQQILQRNRLIARVNYLVINARRDELNSLFLSLETLGDIVAQQKNLIDHLNKKYASSDNMNERHFIPWERLELGEIAQQKGQIAYPYYRLRVGSLTDDLSRMVTQRAGYDKESDYFLAVRELVNIWRRKNYNRGEDRDNIKQKENLEAATPMRFLSDYDYNYRLRRLRFVLQQADRLLKFDKSLVTEFQNHLQVAEAIGGEKKPEIEFTAENIKALQTKFPLVEPEIYSASKPSPSDVLLSSAKDKAKKEELRKTVRGFKRSVNKILLELRRDLRQVEPNSAIDEDNPNKDLIESLNKRVAKTAKKLTVDDLNFLLGKDRKDDNDGGTQTVYGNDSDARQTRATKLLTEKFEIESDLNEIGNILEKIYNGDADFSVFGKSRNRIGDLFNPASADSFEQKELQKRLKADKSDFLYVAVRNYLYHFYENFDAYDQIVFPVTYETPIGEGANVDIARISPLDALGLINENKGRRKVAGGVFFAFGAFFKEEWRKNDILWGRLDTVERFVSIVLNDNLITEQIELRANTSKKLLRDIRAALIEELQEEILQNGFKKDGKSFMRTEYEKYAAQNPSGKKFDRLTEFVSEKYEIDTSLEKAGVFTNVSRASTILRGVFGENDFGKMDRMKEIILHALGLTVNPATGRKEWGDFLKPFYFYIFLTIALLTFPVLVLAATTFFFFGKENFSYGFFLLNLGVVLGIYAIILLYIYGKFWLELKAFLKKFIYSKVTGVEDE